MHLTVNECSRNLSFVHPYHRHRMTNRGGCKICSTRCQIRRRNLICWSNRGASSFRRSWYHSPWLISVHRPTLRKTTCSQSRGISTRVEEHLVSGKARYPFSRCAWWQVTFLNVDIRITVFTYRRAWPRAIPPNSLIAYKTLMVPITLFVA